MKKDSYEHSNDIIKILVRLYTESSDIKRLPTQHPYHSILKELQPEKFLFTGCSICFSSECKSYLNPILYCQRY